MLVHTGVIRVGNYLAYFKYSRLTSNIMQHFMNFSKNCANMHYGLALTFETK